MACTSMSISTTSTPITKEIFRDHNKPLRRSYSNKELRNRASIRRCQSDPQLRCSLNPVATSTEPKLKHGQSNKIFPFQISVPNSVRSLLSDPDIHKEMNLVDHSDEGEEEGVMEKRANWMERLLEVRRNYRSRQQTEQHEEEGNEEEYGDEGGCEVEYELDEEVVFDRESFSKLLDKVSWSDTKLFSQLAFLCNMAYVIPEIKADDLLKVCDVRFVTSSLVKKAEASIKLKLDQDSTCVPISSSTKESSSEKAVDSEQKRPIRSSVAYDIAASAASYVHSRAKNLLSLAQKSSPEDASMESVECGDNQMADGGYSPARYKSDLAAYVAATTMTSVVAAEEAAKQEAAKALQSLHSSPCEWFICDDPSTYTRCFVIQGSDSLASWQANLFFDPCKFEGTDVLVHRGIYEAAKGIYEQFMPEILDHLERHGERAKLRFTGHSLGGSLSLLVNLMLLAREVIKPSTLLPVVTFGSPFVFCGGRRILDQLSLDESHIRSVMMHRDIVPRAFSCNYPNHIAQILKRLKGFRSHPCLNKNKMLYTPLGELFILQPDGNSSPPHPLLPHGSAFYALDKSQSGCYKGISSALAAFLNSPHPLETLSDPTAYGSDGTILRDHDSSNYLKAVNGVLRQHTKSVVERSRRERLHRLWPMLTTQSPQPWSHQQNLENLGLAKKEVVSGV